MLALELAASDRTPKRQLAAPSQQDQPKSKESPYPPRLSAGATPQRRTVRMNVGLASKAGQGIAAFAPPRFLLFYIDISQTADDFAHPCGR